MGRLLISPDHIAGLIDITVEDARNGMGARLYDLAGVIASVAIAQNDSILHVLPHAIGGFGSELMTARSMVAVPMLPEPIRQRLTTIINTAVEDAVSALNCIKEEFWVLVG